MTLSKQTIDKLSRKVNRELEISNKSGTLLIDLMKNEIQEALGSATGPEFVSLDKYEKRDHLMLEHKHFYESILHHKNPIVSLEDGLLAVALIDKVIESVECGKEVMI